MRTNLVPYPPQGLVVAVQYWEGDELGAMRLARLMADIEPARRDDVVLAFCRRFDMPVTELSWDTFLHCGEKFPVMQLRSRREGVGHPHGANELWSGTMDQLSESWAAGRLSAHSVFTVEADCCPLRADWLDVLIAEHRDTLQAGRRVTGCQMNRGMFPHVNGTLLAHLSLWQDRLSLRRTPSDQAWDLFHAAVLMSEARPTTWMRNVYGASNWSPESLENLSGEAAWMSSCKDESALRWAERALPRWPRVKRPLSASGWRRARARG